MKVAQNEIQLKATKSVCLQPRGSIYQNGFLGEVQFFQKVDSLIKKWGIYLRKSQKIGRFKKGEVVFKSGAVYERIRYFSSKISLIHIYSFNIYHL